MQQLQRLSGSVSASGRSTKQLPRHRCTAPAALPPRCQPASSPFALGGSSKQRRRRLTCYAAQKQTDDEVKTKRGWQAPSWPGKQKPLGSSSSSSSSSKGEVRRLATPNSWLCAASRAYHPPHTYTHIPTPKKISHQQDWRPFDAEAYNQPWNVPWGAGTTAGTMAAWVATFLGTAFVAAPASYVAVHHVSLFELGPAGQVRRPCFLPCVGGWIGADGFGWMAPGSNLPGGKAMAVLRWACGTL